MTLPYSILERLGHGAMAEVLLVERDGGEAGPQRAALKRVSAVYLHDEEVVGMFIDEARLLRHLEHPAIPRLLELSFYEGEPFMLLELVEGVSLDDVLLAGALPLAGALHVAQTIASALAHAHAAIDEAGRHLGVVHRDVRPGNIMITPNGDVKLIDFGIARWADRARSTEAGHMVGAVGYLAPEQLRGETATPSSDVYAAGLVLAEMITGTRLFAERDVTARLKSMNDKVPLSGIPERLRATIASALQADPAHRLADGSALQEALAAFDSQADRSALAGLVSSEKLAGRADGMGMNMPHTAVAFGGGW